MNSVKYLLFYKKLSNYLFCNIFGSVLECYELTGVGLLCTSALGLNLLLPNHTIYHLRSWSTQIKVMTSRMMAPSHYLKQCGLIIKLINKVLWHLYLWIIIKDLTIPISKIRLKLVLWYNFTSSPEIIHFILFSSDNSFVLCHGGELIFIATVFNPSDCCLLKGNKVPSPCVFCDHTAVGQCPKNLKQPCCMRSQSHGRLWPMLKLKFGNCWLTSKCCGSSCKKNSISVFNSNSRVFNSNSIFNSTNTNSGIGIAIELQFQFWNWINPNPAICPHNTPHISSCCNNEQTSNGSWCMGIKGEMSGTVCVTFTWYIYIYMSCL